MVSGCTELLLYSQVFIIFFLLMLIKRFVKVEFMAEQQIVQVHQIK